MLHRIKRKLNNKMLLYNTNGTVSDIQINAIIDGKVTSSIVTAPTIQQAFEASASNAIISSSITAGSSSNQAYELAYRSGSANNSGYTYLSSWPSASLARFTRTRIEESDASAFMTKYPTSADLHTRGQVNYWITGSTIIPSASATFVSSSYGLGPVNTTAKVSITSSYFTPYFNSNIKDSNDVKKFGILSYNGVISTIVGYNDFSSSTFNDYTQSFVVMHISASKANMGSVVTNDLIVSLGTTQNSSATRNGNDSTTNVSESMAFAQKYPTNTNKTNRGTTYGYPSTADTTRFARTKTNVTDVEAFEIKYPNNTSKDGWVDDVSPKNQ